METARQIQNEICRIIYKMCSAHGNLYAVMKAILDQNGVHCGSVRKPLPALAGQRCRRGGRGRGHDRRSRQNLLLIPRASAQGRAQDAPALFF